MLNSRTAFYFWGFLFIYGGAMYVVGCSLLRAGVRGFWSPFGGRLCGDRSWPIAGPSLVAAASTRLFGGCFGPNQVSSLPGRLIGPRGVF